MCFLLGYEDTPKVAITLWAYYTNNNWVSWKWELKIKWLLKNYDLKMKEKPQICLLDVMSYCRNILRSWYRKRNCQYLYTYNKESQKVISLISCTLNTVPITPFLWNLNQFFWEFANIIALSVCYPSRNSILNKQFTKGKRYFCDFLTSLFKMKEITCFYWHLCFNKFAQSRKLKNKLNSSVLRTQINTIHAGYAIVSLSGKYIIKYKQ